MNYLKVVFFLCLAASVDRAQASAEPPVTDGGELVVVGVEAHAMVSRGAKSFLHSTNVEGSPPREYREALESKGVVELLDIATVASYRGDILAERLEETNDNFTRVFGVLVRMADGIQCLNQRLESRQDTGDLLSVAGSRPLLLTAAAPSPVALTTPYSIVFSVPNNKKLEELLLGCITQSILSNSCLKPSLDKPDLRGYGSVMNALVDRTISNFLAAIASRTEFGTEFRSGALHGFLLGKKSSKFPDFRQSLTDALKERVSTFTITSNIAGSHGDNTQSVILALNANMVEYFSKKPENNCSIFEGSIQVSSAIFAQALEQAIRKSLYDCAM